MSYFGWWGEKEGSVLHSCSEPQLSEVLPSAGVSPETTAPGCLSQEMETGKECLAFHCLRPDMT